MKIFVTAFISLIILSGCSIFDDEQDHLENIPVQELLAAPDTLILDDQPLVLRTYMWRDFQPISPSDGKPLIAIFWVYSADSTVIPENTTLDAAWLIHNDQIWGSYLTGEDPPPSEDTPYQLYDVLRDGPKWETGIEVDVVLRIRSAEGNNHLIRASNQHIGRTD